MGFTIRRDAKKFVDYIIATKTDEEINALKKGLKSWWRCIEKLNEEFPSFENDSANTWHRRFTASLFYLSEEGAVQGKYLLEFMPSGLGTKFVKLGIKEATRKAANGEALTRKDFEKIYSKYAIKVKFDVFKNGLNDKQQQTIEVCEEEPVPIQTESDDRLHRDAIDMLEIMKIMAADMTAMLASMKKQEKYQQDTNDFLRKLV